MLKNFLLLTLLTGYVNDKFLKNFPNSLLILSNNNYKLTIKNKKFIMKFIINSFTLEGQTTKLFTPLILPISPSSKNFSIDWGDNTTTIIHLLNYKENCINEKNNSIGDYCIINNEINYFNGTGFKTTTITPEDICNNNYYVCITLNNNIISSSNIVSDNIQNNTAHTYNKLGTYYIKIEGGFTGFKPNTITINPFYNTSILTYKNTIFIDSIDSTLSTMNGEYFKTNSYLYINKIDDSMLNTISNLDLNTFKLRKLSITSDNLTFILSSQQNTETLATINKGFNDLNRSAIETDTLTAHYYKPLILKNYLEKIITWGTNVNWQTMEAAFYNALRLNELPDETLPNVNNYTSAFCGCTSLKELPNTSIFPRALVYGSYMFLYTGISGSMFEYTLPPYLCLLEHMFTSGSIAAGLPKNYDLSKNYYLPITSII